MDIMVSTIILFYGCLIGVSINFEGNVDKKPTNENASTNDLSGTKEHHEEETTATTENPKNENNVTGSSNFSNIHYNLTISYVQWNAMDVQLLSNGFLNHGT